MDKFDGQSMDIERADRDKLQSLFPQCFVEGKLDIDSLITHAMPLEKINDAFDLMHEGKSIRSVVTF